MTNIHLISIWPLKDGCTSELIETLKSMPDQIIKNEPGTLHYEVNIPSENPLDSDLKTQAEIVFIETYTDADAFKAHLHGPLFTEFRTKNLAYFHEDPDNPGWAITNTTFLEVVASADR